MKQYYFISGLPRSGSTLLSAILLQNPDFYADIASPVSGLMSACIDSFTMSENNANIREPQRRSVLHGIIDGYYAHIDKPVVFDSSRTWTAKTALLRELWPNTKILCCVRDIRWVLDSFERIAAHNPLYTNTLVDDEARPSVETRCRSLMDPTKSGTVIKPWKWLEEGLALNPEMIHLIEYNQLCKHPEKTMRAVYQALDMPYWCHDFDSVEYSNEPFDRACNMRDLHTVKKRVEWVERKTILPESVWNEYGGKESWRKDKLLYE
jgi:sulfotransferase